MKKLDAEGWIKPKQKHNVEVKVECEMQKEHIDGLAINHSFAHLHEQERMWTLDVEKIESSSKINLKDVSWWITKVAQVRSILQSLVNKVCCLWGGVINACMVPTIHVFKEFS
jgi:hypothetical protein